MATTRTEAGDCTVTGCARPHKARGFCQTHYMRIRRQGDAATSLINRVHPPTCSVVGCERPYVARGLCGMHWQRAHKNDPGATLGPAAPLIVQYGPSATCSVPACERQPRQRWLCQMHARRVRKNGDIGSADSLRRADGTGTVRSDGYVVLTLPNHPLTRIANRVLLHRVVLYDLIGSGPHACHWCGRSVDWTVGLAGDALVADHLDHDTTNNDPANLVPSCHACNSARTR
jgi:hypothetical protein